MLNKLLSLQCILGIFILAGCNESSDLAQFNAKVTPVKVLSFTEIALCIPPDKKHDPFFKPYVL